MRASRRPGGDAGVLTSQHSMWLTYRSRFLGSCGASTLNAPVRISARLGSYVHPGIISEEISSTADSRKLPVLVLSIAKEEIMRHFLNRIWKDTRGQDLVEYALAAGMVALAAVAAMPQLTGVINNVFSAIGSLINSAVV